MNADDDRCEAEAAGAAHVGRFHGHDVYRVGGWLWPVHIR